MRTKDQTIPITSKNLADTQAMDSKELTLFTGMRNALLEMIPMQENGEFHPLGLEWAENGALACMLPIKSFIVEVVREATQPYKSEIDRLRYDVDKLQQRFNSSTGHINSKISNKIFS